MSGIKLGQKVRDVITGFEGIAVTRMEWLNGCVRIAVQPPMRRDPDDKANGGFVPDSKTFDEEELEVLDETPIKLPNRKSAPRQTGGGRQDPPGLRR